MDGADAPGVDRPRETPGRAGTREPPDAGTVVFFADLSWDNEGWGPAHGTEPVIEIVHVPAGPATAAATPPDEQRDEDETPVVLNERRVLFEPVLTLPFSDEVSDALEALGSTAPSIRSRSRWTRRITSCSASPPTSREILGSPGS